MREMLTGTAAVADFALVQLGDPVTIRVDGWQREELTLTITEYKRSLDRHDDLTWVYGIDAGRRLRLALVRCAPTT